MKVDFEYRKEYMEYTEERVAYGFLQLNYR